MTGLEVALIQGGIGLFNTFMGYSAEKEAADLRNAQMKAEHRARENLRITQYNQDVQRYKLDVAAYEQGVKNRTKMTAMQIAQDQLNLNQMMKGMRFASQDASIAQSEAMGKVQAGPQTGRVAGRRMTMTAAAFGRNQAKREEKMLGEIFAHNMRNEAAVMTLDAQNQAAHAQVAYAPQYGPPSLQPFYDPGPSTFSLMQGIGGAALSGFSAGMSQANYRQGLQTKNYSQTV